jgi:hypothetical protein
VADRLPRGVKGGRPAFHAEPAIDRLVQMVLALTAEVSVLSDRLAAVEAMTGVDPEAHAPDASERAQREARREALLERVLAGMLAELEELGERPETYWERIGRIEGG